MIRMIIMEEGKREKGKGHGMHLYDDMTDRQASRRKQKSCKALERSSSIHPFGASSGGCLSKHAKRERSISPTLSLEACFFLFFLFSCFRFDEVFWILLGLCGESPCLLIWFVFIYLRYSLPFVFEYSHVTSICLYVDIVVFANISDYLNTLLFFNVWNVVV